MQPMPIFDFNAGIETCAQTLTIVQKLNFSSLRPPFCSCKLSSSEIFPASLLFASEDDSFRLRLEESRCILSSESLNEEQSAFLLESNQIFPGELTLPLESALHLGYTKAWQIQVFPTALLKLLCTTNPEETCRKALGKDLLWIPAEMSDLEQAQYLLKLTHGVAIVPPIIVLEQGSLLIQGESPQECLQNLTETLDKLPELPAVKTESLSEELQAILYEKLPIIRGAVNHAFGFSALHFLPFSSDGVICLDAAKNPGFFPALSRVCGQILQARVLEDLLEQSPEVLSESLKTTLAPSESEIIAPNILILPGLGLISYAQHLSEAKLLAECLQNALLAMAHCPALSNNACRFALPSDASDPTEEPNALQEAQSDHFEGKVAFVTGAASGIGRSTAWRLADGGAHVAIVDLNLAQAITVADEINQEYGPDTALALACDVSNEVAVQSAYRQTVLTFGGVDIVVNNAGFGLALSIEQTSLADWDKVHNVMTRGYFLVAREAFRIMRQQATGGSLVFVCSKNSVRAGKEVAAYSSAKAAELHMARCLAEEGGDLGIRVNSVLPDAVVRGSSLFDGSYRTGRAAAYGIAADKLEDYYVQRCVLKVPVYPEHVAEAIAWLAGDRSSRTTGGAITVDGGVSTAYMR